MFLNRADRALMSWRGLVNHAPATAYVRSIGDNADDSIWNNGHIAAINGSSLAVRVSMSIRKVTSTILSVIIVLTIVLGYVISSAADLASNDNGSLLMEWNSGLSSTTRGIGSLLSSSGDKSNDGFSNAYAALNDNCKSEAGGDDAEEKASGCIDGMLDTSLGNSDGDDKVVAKKPDGTSCPDANYVVNSLGECVNDNSAVTDGTIKDNPVGFAQKMMSPTDTYEPTIPSLMDILSMVVNRVIVPGYYINSDFQNYAGDGQKLEPYSGDKGSAADIGKDESERNDQNKDVDDTTAHMYAWRDMECKTGLTNPYTNVIGTPSLDTSNCDIPNIGTEAMQDVASLLTATGMQDSAKTEAKTAFGLGYAGDLLPTDDVPLKASNRAAKYTAMELYGYNLNWTSYAGEFDRIKVMTAVRFNLGLSLGNAIKVAGNALSAFGKGFTQTYADDWSKFTDSDNDWLTRLKAGLWIFSGLEIFKAVFNGFKAAGYSLLSDVLYGIEANTAVYGSWYRPDFTSETVYGIRELTSIEKSSLNMFKAKAAMWAGIVDHTLNGLDYATFNAQHALPDRPKTNPVTPSSCDEDEKQDVKDPDGNPVLDADDEPQRECKSKQELESWADYKKENDIDAKAESIELDVSKYDEVYGDANAKYDAMAADWPAALKAAADKQNEEAKHESYLSQIGDIIKKVLVSVVVGFDKSWTHQWYCVNDDGSAYGNSQNEYIQMAVQQGIVKDPGLEAYSVDGKWQCENSAPRPTVIGGLYGSSRKNVTDEYKDTRRNAYNGISLMDILVGNKLDKWGQRFLGWSQNVIVILNTLVGWCFSPILDKIGFTDIAKKGIEQLRDSIYMQFLIIVIGIGGVYIMIKLIRGQPIQGFRQIGMMLLAVGLGFIMLFNTDLMFKVVDDLPTAVERAAVATIFSSSNKDLICDATGAPKGTIGAGSFSDLDGNDTGYNPDAQVRVLQCEIWEAFVLTPWSYGQFGTGVNQLWATGYSSDEGMSGSGEFTIDAATQDIVGTGEVNMGSDTTVHNWAIYQLEHTTSGTITTADKASAKTLDKNMYKLVDLQAGPNNGAGRDSSHFDTWRGADDNKFMIGLTSLPASILGTIAIGGLAIKKIKYTIIANLLLLLSPFVFLIGVFPNQGWVKMRTYMFDVLSNMIKRVMMVVFMSIALVILLDIANGPYTSWTVVAIGIYMVCLAVITYGDEMLDNLLKNVDSKTGDWAQTDDKIKSALTDNRLVNTMGQNIQDVFVGGTGAAIGIVLAGSAHNENSRAAMAGRLNKQLAGANLLGMGNNGKVRGDNEILALDLNAITVSAQSGGTKYSSKIGADVTALADQYTNLMSMKNDINADESRIISLQKQIKKLKNIPETLDGTQKLDGLQSELNARQKSLVAKKKKYEYMRKNYLKMQNSLLKRRRLQNTLKSSSLNAQVKAAQEAGGESVGDVVKNVAKNKMDLEMREIGTAGDIYNEEGVLVDDISLASEASYRIERIMDRSRLRRLREGKSSFIFELNSNLDQDMNNKMVEAQYSLLHTVNDGGYYGTDEDGHPITTISGAIGLDSIDEDTLKRIINSTAHPMELQALIDEAIQTNDWRQVKSEIGNIFQSQVHVNNQFNIWGFGSEDIDALVNQQLIAKGVDPATASIREVDAARAKVVDTLEKSKMIEVINKDGHTIVETDADGKPVMENGEIKIVKQSTEEMWSSQMAASNVIDRFEATRKASLKALLGPEYEAALIEDQSIEGRKKIQQKIKAATDSYNSEMASLSTQREAVISSYNASDYMTSTERNEMTAALKKIDDAEEAVKLKFDDETFKAAPSRVMEKNWREIAMEKKVNIDNSAPEQYDNSDPEQYEKTLNNITVITAAIEMSEKQMNDAIMAKKDYDSMQGYSVVISDMEKTVKKADLDITNIKSELYDVESDIQDANNEISRLNNLPDEERAAIPDIDIRLRELHSKVRELNKDVERCEYEKRNTVSVRKTAVDGIHEIKNDIINDRTEVILPDGTKLDRVARVNSLLHEAQWELDNVINNTNDRTATNAINESIETETVESIDDKHVPDRKKKKTIASARLASDYSKKKKTVTSARLASDYNDGSSRVTQNDEANVFSWDRISKDEINETVKKDTQHHYALKGEEKSTKTTINGGWFGHKTEDKEVWDQTDAADDYVDHVRLEKHQNAEKQQENENIYYSSFNSQQEADRQRQFNNSTDENGRAFKDLLSSGHSQGTWTGTSVKDPNKNTNKRAVIHDPSEIKNEEIDKDVTSSGWLEDNWTGIQDAQGHVKRPRGWRGRGKNGNSPRSARSNAH